VPELPLRELLPWLLLARRVQRVLLVLLAQPMTAFQRWLQ
jgi:hypothetical protein